MHQFDSNDPVYCGLWGAHGLSQGALPGLTPVGAYGMWAGKPGAPPSTFKRPPSLPASSLF